MGRNLRNLETWTFNRLVIQNIKSLYNSKNTRNNEVQLNRDVLYVKTVSSTELISQKSLTSLMAFLLKVFPGATENIHCTTDITAVNEWQGFTGLSEGGRCLGRRDHTGAFSPL